MTTPNVYQFLDAVRTRPHMYVRDFSLRELELYLSGYAACLDVHGIEDGGSGRVFHPRDFAGWLYDAKAWSGSAGFASALYEQESDRERAFELFFQLLEEYRRGE